MKHLSRSLLISLLVINTVTADPTAEFTLATISPDAVHAQVKPLAKKMAQRTIIRQGLMVAGGVLVLHQAHSFIQWLSGGSGEKGSGGKGASITPQVDKEKLGWCDWATSGDTWLGAGKSVCTTGAGIIAATIVNQAVMRSMQEDSLFWFTHTYKPYRPLSFELNAHIERIGIVGLHDEAEVGYHKRGIVSAYNRLIERWEKALGYMQFKKQRLGTHKHEAEELIAHIITTVKTSSVKMDALLHESALSHEKISTQVASMIASVEADLSRFCGFEGYMWIDMNELMRSALVLRKIEAMEAGGSVPVQ